MNKAQRIAAMTRIAGDLFLVECAREGKTGPSEWYSVGAPRGEMR